MPIALLTMLARRRSYAAVALMTMIGAGFCAPPASAALGDLAASVAQDMVSMKASHRIAAGRNYTLHELQTPEGVTIREFVSSAGVVFAIAWQGPFKPSMRLMLGTHFEQYASAAPTADSARSHMRIEQPDLVVRSSGHMRYFSGVAWLPQLLPAGVAEGDLK